MVTSQTPHNVGNGSNEGAGRWLLYGANGYSGRRIARKAKEQGLRPVLAGRNSQSIAALAQELDLPWVAFDVSDRIATEAALKDVDVVAHCAGPYAATGTPMVDACVATKTHYVDLDGEIDVLLEAHARDAMARNAGVALCPGAGFDVIPTDCVAATLKQAMPDATHLYLGFTGLDDVSPGTMNTFLDGIGKATSRVRENGKLIEVPYFSRSRTIDFGDGKGPVKGFNVPWADVALAYFSTGIPNIENYVPPTAGMARSLSLLRPLIPLLRFRPVVRALQRLVTLTVKGPDGASYESGTCHVVGEVRNAKGAVARAHCTTPNGYRLTVDGVLMTVRHLLAHPDNAGFHTPSTLMGARCVEKLPGVSPITVS